MVFIARLKYTGLLADKHDSIVRFLFMHTGLKIYVLGKACTFLIESRFNIRKAFVANFCKTKTCFKRYHYMITVTESLEVTQGFILLPLVCLDSPEWLHSESYTECSGVFFCFFWMGSWARKNKQKSLGGNIRAYKSPEC